MKSSHTHTCIRDVCGPHHAPDLFHALQVRAKAAVHAKDPVIDDGCNWHAVEDVGEDLPYLNVVPPLACVVGCNT
jgi:hypothetical protein